MELTNLIIDTDAGSDDLMAIAWLLCRPEVRIEAITVVNGLAHVAQGARNIKRLLKLAGKEHTPVYCGLDNPLEGNRAFPEKWRHIADHFPVVNLPDLDQPLQINDALGFLESRLNKKDAPVEILALGPLTNLAAVFEKSPQVIENIARIVVMGGAFGVEGNVFDYGEFKSSSDKVEWNIFIDPLAAKIVFEAPVKILVVPLDATNEVLIDSMYFEKFRNTPKGPLGNSVSEMFKSVETYINAGSYFAWDPLAALAMLHADMVTVKKSGIEVVTEGSDSGQTRFSANTNSHISIAVHANRALFFRHFIEAFQTD